MMVVGLVAEQVLHPTLERENIQVPVRKCIIVMDITIVTGIDTKVEPLLMRIFFQSVHASYNLSHCVSFAFRTVI